MTEHKLVLHLLKVAKISLEFLLESTPKYGFFTVEEEAFIETRLIPNLKHWISHYSRGGKT